MPRPEGALAFEEVVEAAIREAAGGPLLASGEGVIVAVSGGPDSTALIHALAAIEARRAAGWRLRVAHVHHGLRGVEADGDRDFVASVAARLGLPLDERRIDVALLRVEEGGTIEEVARRERYRFFEEAAAAAGASKVATGHHRDDQVETVLHRIIRGTGIRGLAGIPRRRRLGGPGAPEVVRPLLGIGRAEVRAYLEALGVAAREDSSNAGSAFLRNRLRHEALPLLRELAPGVDAAIARLGTAARQAAEVLEGEATRRLDAAGIAPTLPLAIPLAALRETPVDLRPIFLMRAVERALGAQLVSRHADALLALASAAGAAAPVNLPRGLVARRVGDEIRVDRPGPAAAASLSGEADEARIRVPGRTVAGALGATVEARVLSRRKGLIDCAAGGRRVGIFDLAQLPGPLVLRRPRPGDAIYPVGMQGRKKLSDLFVDEKIPREARPRVLVLEAGGHIAWVVGLRIDRRFAATDETREALELRVEELVLR